LGHARDKSRRFNRPIVDKTPYNKDWFKQLIWRLYSAHSPSGGVLNINFKFIN
jgi:hypothetical protein